MDATLDIGDLTHSLHGVDTLYSKASFNEEAKFGLLQNAAMKVPDLAAFAIYRGATDYPSLMKVIRDFDIGRRAFHSASLSGPSSHFTHGAGAPSTQTAKAPQLLVRPDARVRNVEHKIDPLADQLADLTLIVKKTQTGNENAVKYGDRDRPCSYCKKPGHGANRCTENPNRDKRCQRCDKMGHTEETCWARRKTEEKPRKKEGKVNVTLEGDRRRGYASSPASSDEESNNNEQVALVVEECNEEQDVLALKRAANGQPIQKSQRGPDGGSIARILNT